MVDRPTVFNRPKTMQSGDLTPAQARALKNKLQPMLGYLNRLKHRMRRRGFPHGDPLLAAVCRAEDAIHALHVEIHYLGCGDVVARRPRKGGERSDRHREQRRRD
jgi:hypothetical protein